MSGNSVFSPDEESGLEQPAPEFAIPGWTPPGASGWRTTDSSSPLPPPSDDVDWSPQAKQLIELFEEFLSDSRVTEVHGYGPSRFSICLDGENHMLPPGYAFSNTQEYETYLEQLVRRAGTHLSWEDVEDDRWGALALADGSRILIILPPLAQPWPTFVIRKHTAANWEPQDFVDRGTLSPNMMRFLEACVASRANILLVGPMRSGKTSLLRTLASSFGDNERIAVVEQVSEIGLTKPLAMRYNYQDVIKGLSLDNVLNIQLYNSLDRLVVGEIHMDGVTRMLETMFVSKGAMSTYHAYNAEDAGKRLLVSLQKENPGMSDETATAFIRRAIELVVVLDLVDGEHRCVEITEINWRTSGGVSQLSGNTLFRYDHEAKAFVVEGRPDQRGRILHKAQQLYGVDIRHEWFQNPDELRRIIKGKR